MSTNTALDLVIVGGGIGGIISLKYAKDAGLNALLLESHERIGGLWRDLPSWQDIQIRKEDWTLGDIPLQGEDQQNILHNIEAWVEQFDLAPYIRVNAAVTRAETSENGWRITTDSGAYDTKWLIAASGAHNSPVIPQIERIDSSITEYHSSTLRDPEALRDQRVTVVGGGASAYDLIDLCFQYGARQVVWIYRSTKWMRPTRKLKYFGTDMRLLGKYQMLGLPVRMINRIINKDLRSRYAKAGVEAIMPENDFDISREQLIPGRHRMLNDFARIERYCSEIQSIHGQTLHLSTGEAIETDLLLWGTGYTMELGYLGLDELNPPKRLNEIASRCYSMFRSIDAPNLFLLAPSVLDTVTSTPWAYAHAAKSIMTHITGKPVFVRSPRKTFTNYFDLVKLLAHNDRKNYPFGLWYLKYLWIALFHSKKKPLPIP